METLISSIGKIKLKKRSKLIWNFSPSVLRIMVNMALMLNSAQLSLLVAERVLGMAELYSDLIKMH